MESINNQQENNLDQEISYLHECEYPQYFISAYKSCRESSDFPFLNLELAESVWQRYRHLFFDYDYEELQRSRYFERDSKKVKEIETIPPEYKKKCKDGDFESCFLRDYRVLFLTKYDKVTPYTIGGGNKIGDAYGFPLSTCKSRDYLGNQLELPDIRFNTGGNPHSRFYPGDKVFIQKNVYLQLESNKSALKVFFQVKGPFTGGMGNSASIKIVLGLHDQLGKVVDYEVHCIDSFDRFDDYDEDGIIKILKSNPGNHPMEQLDYRVANSVSITPIFYELIDRNKNVNFKIKLYRQD
jgi:hypothetical protein